MRIYIASSWRNQHAVEMLTDLLEARGHKVLSFVRAAKASEADVRGGKLDLESWLHTAEAAEKYRYDLDGATKSDLVIYVGPSGTDAWAEVGAACASRVLVLGLWAKGEQAGLMRHMVTAWYTDYRHLLRQVATVAMLRLRINDEDRP